MINHFSSCFKKIKTVKKQQYNVVILLQTSYTRTFFSIHKNFPRILEKFEKNEIKNSRFSKNENNREIRILT